MEFLSSLFNTIDEIIWGAPLLIMLMCVGVMLTLSLRFIQVTHLFKAIKLVFTPHVDSSDKRGDISSFAALCTALASTIGTGNIVGVATAVHMGGPGALFWMFVAAFFGMATKYSECLLAIKYREIDSKGRYCGGPMYYIKNGMHSKLLATLFAVFAIGAGCFGVGTYCQVNSMVEANKIMFDMKPIESCVIISVLVGLVTFGGLKSISKICTKLVPIMALFYIVGCIFILFLNIEELPNAVATIIKSAFNFDAGIGAATGMGILVAMRYGVARGMFSNEAGLGSAPIAAATAKTKYAAEQGLVNMTGTFFDTILICMLTGLAIVLTNTWNIDGVNGARITTLAFTQSIGTVWGTYIVNIGLLMFAFTTIIGWNYYAESSVVYLFGTKVIYIYRAIYVCIVASAAFMTLDLVWVLSDIMNGLMAFPNLIALFFLRKDIIEETKIYIKHLKDKFPGSEEFN
ncbi:MAG: alanine/glycine:cation symporter family protein [Succinivibrionaceae bacterium]